MIKKNIFIVIFMSLFAQSCIVAKDDVLNLAAMGVVVGATGWALYDYYKMPNPSKPYRVNPQMYIPLENGLTREEALQCSQSVQNIIDTYAPGNNEIQFYKPTEMPSYNEQALRFSSSFLERAIYVDNQYSINALLTPAHKCHYGAQGNAGHEIGHIKHGDRSKYTQTQVSVVTWLATASLLSVDIIRENLWKALVPIYVIKETINYALSRYREQRADQHVIDQTTNPQILREMASDLQRLVPEEEHKHSLSILFETHPWSADRIRKLETAATILESQVPSSAV